MKNILHIIHPWGGGIETYINDLKQASESAYSIVTMMCWHGTVTVAHEAGGQHVKKKYYLGEDLGLTDYTNEKYSNLLGQILDKYQISIVHIDSQVGHTFDIFRVPKYKNIPLVCTIHDYFYICPTFHLVDNNGDYCNICKQGEENHDCISHHGYLYSKLDGNDLRQFREIFSSLIDCVDVYVFPSEAAKDVFTGYYDIEGQTSSVIYHGTSLLKKKQALPARHDRNMRVGILGSMLKHKGKGSINLVMSSLEGYPVEFYHFGDGDLTGANLSTLGRYDSRLIVSLLQSKQIDVILLLSTWPETFSYTLTESIAANIPVIATNMGALSERVSAHKIGWLVDYRDIDVIRDLILKLSQNGNEIEIYKQRISEVGLKTLGKMCQEYDELYDRLLSSEKYINNELMRDAVDLCINEDAPSHFIGEVLQKTKIKTRFYIHRTKNKIVNYISKD